MTLPQRLHQLNKEIDKAIADKDFPAVRLLSMERAELEKELNRPTPHSFPSSAIAPP